MTFQVRKTHISADGNILVTTETVSARTAQRFVDDYNHRAGPTDVGQTVVNVEEHRAPFIVPPVTVWHLTRLT